jgi:hypothetical protein
MLNSSESLADAPFAAMAKKVGRPATKPEQAEEVPGQAGRLLRLRKAYGYETSTAFAKFLDIALTTYSGFENGAPLSRQAAFKIVRKIPGVTLDWLYFDNPAGLPLDVARRLGVLESIAKRKT